MTRYILLSLLLTQPAFAQDWPQWRGPQRDGHAAVALSETLPESLREVWATKIGGGYSSPVLVDGRIYIHSREGEQEVVRALAWKDGAELWSDRYTAPFDQNSYALKHGKGPHSTPSVAADRLFTLGVSGILSSYDTKTGKLLWRHDPGGVSTKKLFCGASASPLVHGDSIFVALGDDVAGEIAAFDTESGAKRWTWHTEGGPGPGYASPMLLELGGREQLVTLTDRSIVALDPATGSLLWQEPFPDEWNENIVTPVQAGDLLLVAGVRQGTKALRVASGEKGFTVTEAWTRPDLPQYMTTPVLVGETLYGLSSKQKGQLFALDPKTGRTLWESEGRQAYNAALTAAGETLVLLTGEAELRMFAASPEAYRERARYEVAPSSTWTHPLLADGKVLVRDRENVRLWAFASSE